MCAFSRAALRNRVLSARVLFVLRVELGARQRFESHASQASGDA